VGNVEIRQRLPRGTGSGGAARTGGACVVVIESLRSGRAAEFQAVAWTASRDDESQWVNEPAARLLRPKIFMDLNVRVPERCLGDFPWGETACQTQDQRRSDNDQRTQHNSAPRRTTGTDRTRRRAHTPGRPLKNQAGYASRGGTVLTFHFIEVPRPGSEATRRASGRSTFDVIGDGSGVPRRAHGRLPMVAGGGTPFESRLAGSLRGKRSCALNL
jgi:hypothetical protein